MRTIKILSVLTVLLVSGMALAANWTTTATGSVACTKLRAEGTCFLTNIAADSAAINVSACPTLTVRVVGTGMDIMPQSCDLIDANDACTDPQNMLDVALTGASPNAFMTSSAPFNFIQIDWETGGAGGDVSIKCGR